MSILYVSCLMPEERFYRLFKAGKTMPGQQAQKYHRLMVQGFVQNGEQVTALSLPPVNRANYAGRWMKGAEEQADKVSFRLLPVFNMPGVKHLLAFCCSFFCSLQALKRQPDTAVVLDILNLSVSMGSALAARLCRRKTVGVVTDLPEMMDTNNRGLGAALSAMLIQSCTHYVFLTEAMSDRLNPHHKPYVVIEGQVDAAMGHTNDTPAAKQRPRVLMYAGEISRKYGLETLAEGFLKADIKEAELHYYGHGDYAEDFARLCTQHGSMRFFGVRPNSEVVAAEQRASLLINPRPTTGAFTRYSFPSKNMEYMVSGTPVMTTKLPGMPDSYFPHVFLIEDETVDGMAEALRNVMRQPDAVLSEKGEAARRFVLEQKSNVQAAARILRILKEDRQ